MPDVPYDPNDGVTFNAFLPRVIAETLYSAGENLKIDVGTLLICMILVAAEHDIEVQGKVLEFHLRAGRICDDPATEHP